MAEVLSDGYAGPPMKLDFIYGYINTDTSTEGKKSSIFKPLDGQQRLTTLFLLHWFFAAKENKLNPETKSVLKKFSYATRTKSSQFCECLVEFQPDFEAGNIKSQIKNRPWFFLSWASDPTVASMLVVIKAMESIFSEGNITDAWDKLSGDDPPIIFHLLKMDDLGLPDDLYIKMNSRGKELTNFEHFKSQFSKLLNKEHKDLFDDKMDGVWSDLFWDLFKNHESDDIALKVDSGFLNFFWYITDMLIAKNGFDLGKSDYWLDIIEAVYSKDENAEENVSFLFSCLDLFTKLEGGEDEFFEQYFYKDENGYEHGKTRLFFNNPELNLFQKCAKVYGKTFSIGEQLMLYACIVHKLENTKNFGYNIRVIRNYIASSEDNIRQDYLGSLYHDVGDLVNNGPLKKDSKFSKTQSTEEATKLKLRNDSPELNEVIFKLEDHHLLRGTISIFTIANSIKPFAEKFHVIFKEGFDYYEISKAMLTVGDYSQGYGNKWRLGHAESTWRELFTPSEKRKGFEATQNVLKDYLSLFIKHDQTSNDGLISAAQNAKKDWRYYYIKYENFRVSYKTDEKPKGFYHWENYEVAPFDFHMMFAKQFNGRNWNPFLLEVSSRNDHCTIENDRSNIQFTLGDTILMISMTNSAFRFEANDEDTASVTVLSELKRNSILNENGCLAVDQVNEAEDNEDRILLCLATLATIEEHLTHKANS